MGAYYCPNCKKDMLDCSCDEGKCVKCGQPLDAAEIDVGRDECFECFSDRND